MTEMGEFLVGAWLKEKRDCDIIQYNARLPEGHLPGLNEVDVIGLDFKKKIAYVCEVITHLDGLLYGGVRNTIEKLKTKFQTDREYAEKILIDFPNREYSFWSPVVPEGKLTTALKELQGVELITNGKYAERIEELKKAAHEKKNDTGNPAFRLLQILEHLRRPKHSEKGVERGGPETKATRTLDKMKEL